MNRRDLLKQVAATAVVAGIQGKAMASINERKYDSATISVRLVEAGPSVTSVYLTEHGDADYAVVEAFYYTTFPHGVRIMLHKETTTPLFRGMIVGAELLMPMDSIVFIRVKEMKQQSQNEFGDAPKG